MTPTVLGLMADKQANGRKEELLNYWVIGMKRMKSLLLR